MLDIQTMVEADKLFYFLKGLKPFARNELQRQRVNILAEAQTVAERLTDYTHDNKSKNASIGHEGGKSGKPGKPKSGGASSVSSSSSSAGGQKKYYNSQQSSKSGASNSGNKPSFAYFLCNDPHKVAECPHKAALNALAKKAESDRQDDSDSDGDSGEQPRVGALHILSAVGKTPSARTKNKSDHELMFVKIHINGKSANALVDSGATHNFIDVPEAQRLGLVLIEDASQIKAVNSKACPVQGVAKNVKVKVGDWNGSLDFTAVPLDDFRIALMTSE